MAKQYIGGKAERRFGFEVGNPDLIFENGKPVPLPAGGGSSEVSRQEFDELVEYTKNLSQNIKAIAANQEVSSVREGAVYNGIRMHCVHVGAVYSYFSGESTVTDNITIAPTEGYPIASDADFPELALYQGTPLMETGRVVRLDLAAQTFVNEPVMVLVDSAITIVNMGSEPLTILAGSMFTFNKILVLGQPG